MEISVGCLEIWRFPQHDNNEWEDDRGVIPGWGVCDPSSRYKLLDAETPKQTYEGGG